jgi:hypothetical protein
MGYDVDYIGHFDLNKQLTDEHAQFIKDFARTRHYLRAWKPEEENGIWWVDPEDKYSPVWNDPEFLEFLNTTKIKNLEKARSEYTTKRWGCIDYNKTNTGMPDLWCQWIPTDNNWCIIWDGGEKFYKGIKWLEFIIENYLKPWGYVLNGNVLVKDYGNNESGDGQLIVEDNKITFIPYENE